MQLQNINIKNIYNHLTLKHCIGDHVPQGINIMANMPPAVVDQGLFSLNITIIILKCKNSFYG